MVKVYGWSGDLIEIEGDIDGCDEYPCTNGFGLITFSDGSIFSVSLIEDDWVIKEESKPQMGFNTRYELHMSHGSDVLSYLAPVTWVTFTSLGNQR